MLPADLGTRSRVKCLATLLLCAGLSSCALYVERPTATGGSLTEEGATYSEALHYIETTRGKFDFEIRRLVDLEGATKAGVGLGLAGAGAAGAFGASANTVLGFLTLGAVSYSAHAATDPPTLTAVLNAGLNNLECIESAGDQANTAFAGQKYLVSTRRSELVALMAALAADIQKAAQNPAYTQAIIEPQQTYRVAEVTLGAMDDYLRRSPVASEMIRASRRTIIAVNQQLRERSPSIDAIAQSGSILGSFLKTGAQLQASAAEGAGKIRELAVQKGDNPILSDLASDVTKIKAKLAEISTLMTPISIAAVTQCQAQFSAVAPLTLLNPVPVELNAGATILLRTVSGGPAFPKWSSEFPADLTWHEESGGLSMTARPDAKDKSYKLRLADFSGHNSDEFTMNVHAAPKAAAETKAPAAAETKAAPAPAAKAAPAPKESSDPGGNKGTGTANGLPPSPDR